MENMKSKMPVIGTEVGKTFGLAQSQIQPQQEQLAQQQQQPVGSNNQQPVGQIGLAASGLQPQQGVQQNGYQILGAPKII